MDIDESTKQAARRAIRKIAGTEDLHIVDIEFAEVNSVNMTERTCVVTPITGKSNAQISDVSLSIDRNDGEIRKPTIGSIVGIAISNQLDAFVFAWSDLDMIIWKGGNYNGLVKVKELTDKLNNLEQKVNNLINAMATHTHLSASPGSPTGVSTASVPPYTPDQLITPTQQSELENTLIKHGSK